MKKNQQQKFFKKTLSCAIATALLGLNTLAFAQSPVDIANQKATNATNPFGNNNGSSEKQEIKYSADSANVNGNKKIVVQPNLNPALAQQQAGITSAPTTLPQEYSTQNVQNVNYNRGNTDETEALINILNTQEDKIKKLRSDLYKKARVISKNAVDAPTPVNGIITAHLSPNSTSPVIRAFKNKTSGFIITDASGQPWPIKNFKGLSDEDFEVTRLDKAEGYMMSVTPRGDFVSGNLILVLEGLNKPFNIEFVSAQKEVDVQTEIRVQGKGPNTQYGYAGLPSSVDTQLLSILSGVTPNGTKELKTSTNAVQAWMTSDGTSMYVRTRYKIMSPAYENISSSPDGTYAYKMIMSPVVLFKVDDGRFGEFSIEGF